MKKRIISTLSLILMLCVLTMTVYAIEVPDLDRTGSISIILSYEDKAVPGGSLTLYRVGEVHVENGADYSFRYVEPYQDCKVSLDNLASARTAQELAEYTADKAIKGTTVKIDDKGCVSFVNLELGLYLLVQEEAAEGFMQASPFLVSVPGREGDSYVYDVDASPKLDLEPAPTEPTVPTETTEPVTEPTKPSEPTEPKLPQTGQNNWPIPVLLVMGLFLVVLGFCLRASGRKKSHEG